MRRRNLPTRAPSPEPRTPASAFPPRSSLFALRSSARLSAFTLIELLVVIVIMLGVAAATMPVMNAMYAGSRESAGVNTLTVAVAQARMYATADPGPKEVSSGSPPTLVSVRYQGAALILDQAGDIRLVEHNQAAKDTAGVLLHINNPSPPPPSRRGYQDLGLNYIQTPANVGYVGIIRHRTGPNSSEIELIAPPFAIAFDQQGRLLIDDDGPTYASTLDDRVFYDADFNGRYDTRTSADRPDNYKPSNFLNRASNYSVSADKWILPFEVIETVAGVLVYDTTKITDLTSGSNGYIDNSASSNHLRDQLLAVGQPVFFSRMTGAPIKNIQKANQP
jgi:type II secretory pathway pseudopilin PulG